MTELLSFLLLLLQTYRELVRLSEGVGFRVHIMDKASLAAKKYGPQSNKKYGKKQILTSTEDTSPAVGSYVFPLISSSADILVSTPNRLIFLLKQDPPALDLSRYRPVFSPFNKQHFFHTSH